MKKEIIDVDKIFDRFLVKYIDSHRGRYSEKEWEDKIPVLYEEFGKTPQEELGGVAPEHYYDGLNGKELVETLKKHIEDEVAVSDFLCEAIIASGCENELAPFVNEGEDEELVSYCVNLLNDMNSTVAFPRYFDMLISENVCEDMKDLLCEMLKEKPEAAKERALKEYKTAVSSGDKNGVKIYLLEILSCCKHDERIFEILISELKTAKNGVQLYLPYVSKYGDERALPVLMELIEKPDINYLDFKELKLAIEAFGGEYDKKRDFSTDKYYKKLKGGAVDESKLN